MTAAAATRFVRPLLRSPLGSVTDEVWDDFVAKFSCHPIGHVTSGGALGSFELRPRRLGEIEVMENLRRDDRGIWQGDLRAAYVALGRDALLQYRVFSISMCKYAEEIDSKKVVLPFGVTRSGALAVLHCGGRQALSRWPDGAFLTTQKLFESTNGMF